MKILGDLSFPEHQNPQNERLRFGDCGSPTGISALQDRQQQNVG